MPSAARRGRLANGGVRGGRRAGRGGHGRRRSPSTRWWCTPDKDRRCVRGDRMRAARPPHAGGRNGKGCGRGRRTAASILTGARLDSATAPACGWGADLRQPCSPGTGISRRSHRRPPNGTSSAARRVHGDAGAGRGAAPLPDARHAGPTRRSALTWMPCAGGARAGSASGLPVSARRRSTSGPSLAAGRAADRRPVFQLRASPPAQGRGSSRAPIACMRIARKTSPPPASVAAPGASPTPIQTQRGAMTSSAVATSWSSAAGR